MLLEEQIRNALLLEPQLEKKRLEMEIDLEKVQITANEEIMSHVWINLLENAVKFSPEGAVVKVSLKRNENYAEASIFDKAIGKQ